MNTEDKLKKKKAIFGSHPEILNLQKKSDLGQFQKLLRQEVSITDDYEEQLREYFSIQNPQLIFQPDLEQKFCEYKKGLEMRLPLWKQGRWVYFPWLFALSHILEEGPFFQVRTARNRELITKAEQKKFYNATIGIAGLSVGNSVAVAIVLQGGSGHIKLADHDQLALSNTNRIRAGVQNLGAAKTDLTAREIYTLNPYAKVEIFPDGLTIQNVKKFFKGLDVVVDEIDNLAMKYKIREYAQKYRLPVIMGADNGDGVVVDIERYDINPHLRFFHGRMGKTSFDSLANLSKLEIGKKIASYVEVENISPRMRGSLLEIGKTIVSWPQLGGAAMLNGAAIAYCARRILMGQTLASNRIVLSFDEKFSLVNKGFRKNRKTLDLFIKKFDI